MNFKPIIFLTITVFTIAYILLSFATLGVLSMFNAQMTGMFQWFVIVSAIVVAASFYYIRGQVPPTTIEKIFVISSSTIIAFAVTSALSHFFNINQPVILTLAFGFVVAWFPFGAITKNTKDKLTSHFSGLEEARRR